MSEYSIWSRWRILRLGLTLAFGLALLVALLLVMGAAHSPEAVLAQGPAVRYVAPAPLGDDGGNDCTDSGAPCATIQHAVDVADPGDEIRVATGTYTDVHARPRHDLVATGVVTQVVYISRTITIRGGYAPFNWTASYPITQPTTLDAQQQGRVLYIVGAISTTVEGLHITGGDAGGLGGGPSGDSGGGVLVITATVAMSNNQVFGNAARFGGGLFFYHSENATLTSNEVISNTGKPHAGGLCFRESSGATLIGNTISHNRAPPGGAHYGGVLFMSSDDARLVDNIVSGNHAADRCGGVCFASSNNAMLEGNVIVGNTSGTMGFAINAVGGGLSFVSSNGADLIGNIVIDNGTLGRGGGLFLERSYIRLVNNVVANNRITKTINFTPSGSGLYIAGSSPELLHTTIARNSGGDGNGVYVTDAFGIVSSSVALTNTILVSHTVGISVAAGNTATLEATLWGADTWANLTDWGGAGTILTGTVNLWGDPAFLDPDAGDYHIGPGSAAIDAGVDAGVDDDMDGEPRPIPIGDGDCDIGADEFPAALRVTKWASPALTKAGAPLTYTLRVTNAGVVDLHAVVTDVLPAHVVSTGVLTWAPTITAPGGIWTQPVVITVVPCYRGALTNVVQVTTAEGVTGVYTETSLPTGSYCLYLPLVFKND